MGGERSVGWSNSTLRGTYKGHDCRFSNSRPRSALSKGTRDRELRKKASQVLPVDTGRSVVRRRRGDEPGDGETSVRRPRAVL